MFGLLRPRCWADPVGAAAIDGRDATTGALGARVVELDGIAVSWRRTDGDTAPLGRLAPGEWLVVALHGLGANERQVATLVPLDVPGVVVAPRGPHRRGRSGWSWSDPPTDDDAALLAAPADLVAAFTSWAAQRAGVGPDRTVVLGHSQGAAVAAAVSLRHPEVAATIVLTTAALPRGLTRIGDGAPHRAYVAVGLRDGLVDDVALAELRCHWRDSGTMLRSVDHDLPHVVSPALAAEVSRWIVEELPA